MRPRQPTPALVTGVTPAGRFAAAHHRRGSETAVRGYLTRERHRSDAVNEPRRVAAAAAAGKAGKGAGDELQRRRLPGNGGNDAREGVCTNSRVLRVPTVSRESPWSRDVYYATFFL